jgi:capsular polysaccharide transport system permease protein
MSASYIHTKRKLGFTVILLRVLAYLYFIALAVAIGYLWLCTQNRYITTAEFKVSHHGSAGNEVSFATSLLPGAEPGSVDSQLVIGFVNSADLLLKLEQDYQLAAHYQSPARDWAFRLKLNANLEERLIYYRSRIFARYDLETGMTILSVDTFDPKLTRDIATVVIKQAETFMNTISKNIADQRLEFVRSEVEHGSAVVEKLNGELLALQNDNNFITPGEVISATLGAVQKLRLDRLQGQTELSSLQRTSPNSPRIDSLRSRLSSLEELIAVESAKLSGPEQNSYNQLLARYKILDQKIDFATRVRNDAQMSLERNRVEAIAKSRYLTVVQQPYLPEDVGLPLRPYATMTMIILGLLMFLIFRAITKAVFSMV